MLCIMRTIKPVAAAQASDEQIINTWLRNQRSELTRGVYRRDTAKLLRFTGKPLWAITLDDLQAFSAELTRQGLAPISVVRTLAAVRSLMRFASRSGHLAKNVAADLKLPRYENRLAERILGEADTQRIIALEKQPRNRVLLLLLYTAGLRVSEACNLRGRNLRARGDAGQLTVLGKGGKTRAILLPATIWQELLSLDPLANPEAPVFRSRTGKALDRSRVLRIVQAAAKRAGIDQAVSPHWLRHAHATHSLERGAPIHLVQATLGHASIATTSRYLHARPSQSSAEFIVAC
jgi:site-specific recombinase XerD